MDVKAKGRGSRNESKERFDMATENQIVAPSFTIWS